jgi:hypothetical protein
MAAEHEIDTAVVEPISLKVQDEVCGCHVGRVD